MNAKPTLAVFDFDGTIYARDSLLDFIRFIHGEGRLYLAAFKLAPWILSYYTGRYSNTRLKERLFAHFLADLPVVDLAEWGRQYAEHWLPRHCYPGALDVLAWHRARGHRLYLLTASSDIWLGAWARGWGMEVVGTEWIQRGDFYTGKIWGKNCHGEEKQRRLAQIIEREQPAYCYGYGDHPEDQFFLSLADEAFPYPLNESGLARWQTDRLT